MQYKPTKLKVLQMWLIKKYDYKTKNIVIGGGFVTVAIADLFRVIAKR